MIVIYYHHDHVYEHDECINTSAQDDREFRRNGACFYHLGISDALCHIDISSVALP